MKFFKYFTSTLTILLLFVLFGIGFTLQAQVRMNTKNAEYLIKRLETNTDQFRDNLDIKVVNAANEEMRESLIEARVAGLEYMTDRLRDRVEDNEVITSDVEDVLSRALSIDQTLQRVKISADARADWMRIKSNLDDLAKIYNVSWVWTLEANPYWRNPAAVEAIVDDLEDWTDRWRRSFDAALDASRLDGTSAEDSAIQLAEAFEDQVDRWEDLADNERLSQANFKLLLDRAMAIETFMRTNNLMTTRAYRDWNQVKANLSDLARLANIDWNWKQTVVSPNRPIR